MTAMEVEHVEQAMDSEQPQVDVVAQASEENPVTPAKPVKGIAEPDVVMGEPASAPSASDKPGAVPATVSEGAATEVETPPKRSQADEATDAADKGDDADDDSNEALGLQLYYLLLRSLFKELDLYAQPAEAGLLDPKKQMLVYHHAARLFELKVDVLGALHGDFALTANLPVAFQKVARKLRKRLQEQGQLERLDTLNEKDVFGHDHAIRFVESNLPAGAKDHCVWLREKPHAQSDHLKSISPFRDVVKFHCFRNPLMLIEDHSMGVVLSIEKTFPVAYLVVSPFLKKPEPLVKCCMKSWQLVEETLSEHLMNFIADDSDGWRSFVQRRANIVSKGSLQIIQRVLRLKPNKDGLDGNAVQALQDLQDEVETLRERAKKAEETAAKHQAKESLALEGKLYRTEGKMIDFEVVAKKLEADNTRMSEELDVKGQEQAILEDRADLAERAVVAQEQEQKDLRARCADAVHYQLEAEQRRDVALKDWREALELQTQAEEEARGKAGEAELLAGGVQEMMVELKRVQVAKKQAIEQAEAAKKKTTMAVEEAKQAMSVAKKQATEKLDAEKQKATVAADEVKQAKKALAQAESMQAEAEAFAQENQAAADEAENLRGEVQKAEAEAKKAAEKAEAKKIEAAEALAQAAQEKERATEAKHQEVVALATLQVKEEAVERITASNVELRAEAAMAKEEAAEHDVAKSKACDDAAKARQELEGRDGDIKKLQGTVAEHIAYVKGAKQDVDKANVIKLGAERKAEEAECKAVECKAAEAEMAARLQIKLGEITNLTSSCGSLTADVHKLTESLHKESERASIAEQAMDTATAQLSVKTRTIESMTADNTALRVSLMSAKDKAEESVVVAEKAVADKAVAETAASTAKESKAKAVEELHKQAQTVAELEAVIVELRAQPRVEAEALEAKLVIAKGEADEAERCAAEAQTLATQAHSQEAQWAASFQLKAGEADKLTNECATLRAEAATHKERTARAEERATESELAEVAAKASLQFKTDDVERVCAANVELRTESLEAKSNAEEATTRAEKAEKALKNGLVDAHRERDQAQAELRGKVAAAESMAAAIGAVRTEAQAARAAEAAAIDVAKSASKEVKSAEKDVREAQKCEEEAIARLQVKVAEASRMTSECSTLRGDVALLREKGDASTKVIMALAATCEKLKVDLTKSEAKHDWSKLNEPVPDFSSPPKHAELTIEDVEVALGEAFEPEEPSVAAPVTLGRRLRSKGPECRLLEPVQTAAVPAAEVEIAEAASPAAPAAIAGSMRRLRSKTPEPLTQKRARVIGSTDTVADKISNTVLNVAIDAD